MKVQKSIRSYGQQVQDQFKELLSSPYLKGRIMLGSTEDFEWQQLNCIVPIKCPAFRSDDLTTVRILVRFNAHRVPTTPGLYIESPLIPPQIRFINITEDAYETQNIKTVKDVVVDVLKQIDNVGLVKWAQKIYEAHLSNNKMHLKPQVNQNSIVQQNPDITPKIPQKKSNPNPLESLGTNLQLLSSNKQFYFNNSSHLNSAFRLKNIHDQQQKQEIVKKEESGTMRPILSRSFNLGEMGDRGDRGFGEIRDSPMKMEEEGRVKDDKTNTDENFCGRSCGYFGRRDEGFGDGNQMFMSPFSCFKPISDNSKGVKNKSSMDKTNIKIQAKNEDFLKLPSFGFNSCSNLARQQQQEITQKQQKVCSDKQEQSFKGEVFSLNEYPQSMMSSMGDKHGKHPKPMNKNANLPKFLIRIFIKYVDKFKSMYVKKQYDRLYAQCKKMKEWKKNDRRQHAFGLKHLKIFFQDFIQGFPDPALNRKVISKIIDHFLLEEICQNSQIPQSHRVGYLIACRVYSIRCRNVSLAGRIQSK